MTRLVRASRAHTMLPHPRRRPRSRLAAVAPCVPSFSTAESVAVGPPPPGARGEPFPPTGAFTLRRAPGARARDHSVARAILRLLVPPSGIGYTAGEPHAHRG